MEKSKFKTWRKARIVRAIGMLLTLTLGWLIPYAMGNIFRELGWAILLFVCFQLIFPISDKIEEKSK